MQNEQKEAKTTQATFLIIKCQKVAESPATVEIQNKPPNPVLYYNKKFPNALQPLTERSSRSSMLYNYNFLGTTGSKRQV